MARVDAAIGRTWSPAVRKAIAVAVVAVMAFGAAFIVWFVGFDPLWAMAAVLAVGPVGALLATRNLEDDPPWDLPGREAPRSTRLTVTTIERSLAACDRLARPPAIRRLQTLLFAERDDRLARLTVLRQLRALLVAELRDRGLDPAVGSNEALALLLGPDALAILQPHDDHPISAAAIARCLDAVERLGTTANNHHETSR